MQVNGTNKGKLGENKQIHIQLMLLMSMNPVISLCRFMK